MRTDSYGKGAVSTVRSNEKRALTVTRRFCVIDWIDGVDTVILGSIPEVYCYVQHRYTGTLTEHRYYRMPISLGGTGDFSMGYVTH